MTDINEQAKMICDATGMFLTAAFCQAADRAEQAAGILREKGDKHGANTLEEFADLLRDI